MSRPSGLIANKGLELLTFGTPNGHKASIILEELKDAYGGPDYVYQSISIMENIQKEPWFTKYGPNGRIPVLVDHDKGGLGIMEGAGQANHFYRLAKERIPYPTQRYVGETERLYGVLDKQLEGKEYLVGNKYSVADIANFSWVNVAYFAGVDLAQFPNLHKWWERINSRPAVKRGTSIPSESKITNAPYQERLKNEPEFKEQEDKLKETGNKAKEQYDYKYASP